MCGRLVGPGRKKKKQKTKKKTMEVKRANLDLEGTRTTTSKGGVGENQPNLRGKSDREEEGNKIPPVLKQ